MNYIYLPQKSNNKKKVYTEKEKELMELAVPLGINTMVYRGQKDIFHDLNHGSGGGYGLLSQVPPLALVQLGVMLTESIFMKYN